jgi:putative pyrroloquinoline-quinone binding quinoprotein
MKTPLLIFALLLTVKLTLAQDFVGHTHDILTVKFNRDATQLISYSAGDAWLLLWDVRSGRLLWRTKTEVIQKGDEYYTLTSFAFSPDQSLITSGSGNGTVQLWDAKTGRLLWRADAHKDSVTAVEFSPDGKTIVSAASPAKSGNEIKVLRVEDGQVIKKLEGEPCTVVAMKFDDAKFLRTGTLDGNVSHWNLETGKQTDASSAAGCRLRRTYEWEISFTPDLKTSASRTGEGELTLIDTQANTVKKKVEAEGYRIYSRFSEDGLKLIVSRYGGFTFYDLATGDTRGIDQLSSTGSTIDLSGDGSLFAAGGIWGISITETKTGKSWLLGGPKNPRRVPPYNPSELELRLTKEQEQNRIVLNEAKARRDAQAAIDAEKYRQQVYIGFEHYGDMTNPLEQRMFESGEPNKSKAPKSADSANAIWLRLHNDSPLPIKIPTQSMYLRNPKCFCELSGKRVYGLCDGREVSIWLGLENKSGKQLPYGLDFGSVTIVLPKTSILFAVPREDLRNGNAIRFDFSFQSDPDEDPLAQHGTKITLRFRESDLPKGQQKE